MAILNYKKYIKQLRRVEGRKEERDKERGNESPDRMNSQQPHLYFHGQSNISSISFSPEKKKHSEEKQVR